jgi:hypothetical protein
MPDHADWNHRPPSGFSSQNTSLTWSDLMSGVGMNLGNTSFQLLALWFIGAAVLGIVIAYGVSRAGRLNRSERETLDRRTVAAREPGGQQGAGDRTRITSPTGWAVGGLFMIALLGVIFFYTGRDSTTASSPDATNVTTGSGSGAQWRPAQSTK